MKINQRLKHVEGVFNTLEDQLIAVKLDKYKQVVICVKSNMNIPLMTVKLHSEDTFGEAQIVLDDAYNLAKEICRRFNEFPKILKK
ncbi:hypothetical protein [Riemerella columbina]|uniref:hypothetical protein n=1 Tax=Riemerella columbina TaxID=103810 RepID=UPI00036E25BF|nr:hypothetical protein [Riemerella columbina]